MLAKRERLYINRLRALPPSVFDVLVRKIVKGDSINSIAKYAHSLHFEISIDNFRKYLAVLAKEIGQAKHTQRVAADTQKEINEFNQAVAEAAQAVIPPAPLPPDRPPGPGDVKKFVAQVTRAFVDVGIEEKLNYLFMVQMKRLDRMVEMEERVGMVFPMGFKNIDSLRMICEVLLKKEAARTLFIDNQPSEKNISPLAQRLSKFDDVDRNLIRQGASKIIQMIEEEADGKYTDPDSDGQSSGSTPPESVGDDPTGAVGTPQNGDSGNSSENVAGSAGDIS